MATSIRVEINRAGAIALLKSPGVLADLMKRGHRVAAAAGPGHMVTSYTGRTRSRVSIITTNHRARRAEAIDRSLTRALDAARG